MDDEINLPSVNWFLEKSQNCLKNKEKIDYKNLAVRPPYSYSQIIVHAFIYYGYKKLSLSDIYAFFVQEYGYFRQQSRSWRNSVRHLLSLDKRFIKVPRQKGERGKGAFWLLDQDSVEKDGTLKPAFIARQSRRMPAPRAKMKNSDTDMKPHMNPIVEKYLARLRPLKEFAYFANELDHNPFPVAVPEPPNVENFEFDGPMSIDRADSDEFLMTSNETSCSQESDFFTMDLNSPSLQFASIESFDDFLNEAVSQASPEEFHF
ncbi:hypothetical protein FO519_007863 [Halicephalobus sp. NKZ332]|nr:hypothetical protein FO519_007863 [Halicephalobus sp. NKZ332]